MADDVRRFYRYRAVFVAWHGPPPHPCHFCRDPVTRWGQRAWDGCIHHVDGNHENNDPANLAAAHQRCHGLHHHAVGRVMPVESSERKRVSAKSKAPCPGCGVLYNPIWMTRHVNAGMCTDPTPEQLAGRERLSAMMAEKARQRASRTA